MYRVKCTKDVEIDADEAIELTALVLQDDFVSLSQDINRLRHKPDLQRFELEDHTNFMEMRNAMKTLLRYYMTHEDYLEFMELQRVYGNVE